MLLTRLALPLLLPCIACGGPDVDADADAASSRSAHLDDDGAGADDDDEDEDEDAVEEAVVDDTVVICHATHAAMNPWTELLVDVDDVGGHGDHGDDLIPAPPGGCS